MYEKYQQIFGVCLLCHEALPFFLSLVISALHADGRYFSESVKTDPERQKLRHGAPNVLQSATVWEREARMVRRSFWRKKGKESELR